MIALRTLFPLDLSSASGLVQHNGRVFVVADDEHFLDAYELDSGKRERLMLPLGDALPTSPVERKRAKADLESLVVLQEGLVLAVGSGSSPARERAVVIDVAANRVGSVVDLHPLYVALREELPMLNIEGACVGGDILRLLHRGNATHPSAIIELNLPKVLEHIDARTPLSQELVKRIIPVDVGVLDGVPLGFTDACPFDSDPSQFYFLAAAEDTANPYDDGECVGSVLGRIDSEGRILRVERIEGRHKMEGLSIQDGVALMVADPDSPDVQGSLFQAELSADWFR